MQGSCQQDPSPTESDSTENLTKQFLPTQREWWGILGCVVYAAVFTTPFALLAPIIWLIPAGDNWPLAILRSLIVLIGFAGVI